MQKIRPSMNLNIMITIYSKPKIEHIKLNKEDINYELFAAGEDITK